MENITEIENSLLDCIYTFDVLNFGTIILLLINT